MVKMKVNPSAMTWSETQAYLWLKAQGYKDITFTTQDSPDFIVEDGKGFEVKLIRANTLFFSTQQFRQLREFSNELEVLVFEEKNSQPIMIIPFSKIANGRTTYKNIRIKIGEIHPDAMGLTYHLGQNNWELAVRVNREARKLKITSSEFVQRLIEEYFQDKHNKNRTLFRLVTGHNAGSTEGKRSQNNKIDNSNLPVEPAVHNTEK